MIKIIDKKNCSGCGACYAACPRNCIEMKTDNEGFLYPIIEQSKCINCNICEKVCPIITPLIKSNKPIVYAAYNKDENIRLKSSSGGIFTFLAEYVISQNGVVFGACFNEKLELIHSFAETYGELEKFRGSKYLQSVTYNTYRQAKKFLESGRIVLYTGTPCQINGLLAYLQKDYDNLITQDLICHGVPSPLVWKKYIEYREKHAGSPIEEASFRNKDSGWNKYSVLLKFKNNTFYKKINNDDVYMKGFLSNLYLRPSCYDCAFKTINRQSDITLADFWGIENIFPELNDDKGISAVILNNVKGLKTFDEIKNDLLISNRKIDMDLIVKYNSSIIKSSNIHKTREYFFNNIDKMNLNQLFNYINKNCTVSFYLRMKINIYKILSKIKHAIIK